MPARDLWMSRTGKESGAGVLRDRGTREEVIGFRANFVLKLWCFRSGQNLDAHVLPA